MAHNYIIGVGGTGARVIEAVLHCCAAGFGPEKLSIMLVDPDDGNGNLTRTKTLIHHYQQAHDGITERLGPGMRAFATEVSVAEPSVWGIFTKKRQTLADYINYENLTQSDKNLSDFVSVLFSDKELSTPLDEGFRGHPSIGAVVMAGPDMTVEPWKSFWDEVREARQNEARVLLVGSIFGGTGAAGVPTFGAPDMLKRAAAVAIDPARGTSKIHLGAALVLPYFSVSADANHEGQMFVTSDDFPIATKAALQYYDEKELAFDEIYLIGDSLAPKVGQFSPGSVSQMNRSHYIELVTALAGFDFFRQPISTDNVDRRFFSAGRDGDLVDWKSLPVTRDAVSVPSLQDELKLRLATFTAFAYAMATYGNEMRNKPHDSDGLDVLPWYRRNFVFDKRKPEAATQDPRQGLQKTILDDTTAFCRRFLEWVSEIDENNVALIDRTKLWTDDMQLVSHAYSPKAIGTFVKNHPGPLPFSNFETKLGELSLLDKNMRPAARFVNLFYDAALRFCMENYGFAGAGV